MRDVIFWCSLLDEAGELGCGGDCDDARDDEAAAEETCNGRDDDRDGAIDEDCS